MSFATPIFVSGMTCVGILNSDGSGAVHSRRQQTRSAQLARALAKPLAGVCGYTVVLPLLNGKKCMFFTRVVHISSS